MSIFFMSKIIIALLFAITMTGCSNVGSVDLSIYAVTTDGAAKWADDNKTNPNARLYVVRSNDLRGAFELLQAMGVEVPGVKDGGVE
jgi:photosystem II stability/assembly factor-like uncharacterized protein